MRRTLEPSVDRAREQAAATAERAGVEIAVLDDLSDIEAASRLFAEIWGTGRDDAQLPPELLRALVHAGNYAAGAFAEGSLIGAVAGFLGEDGGGLYLHSHILGVSASRRGGSIGLALKQHQRAWSLGRGLRRITWTFDPLVRANAHFNLQKLGADAACYYESFYGPMTDGVNTGDESDRLLIEWVLDDSRADEAAGGRLDEPDPGEAERAGGVVILSESPGGAPCVTEGGGRMLLCATPPDIVELRRRDPGLALRWRRALRETLGRAMRNGYHVSGFSRSGWYVLTIDDGHV